MFGALRSGTTLLRLMFDGHTQIVCPGERDFMLDHLRESPDRLVFDRKRIETDRVFHASGLRLPETVDGREAFFDLLNQHDTPDGSALVLVLHRKLDLLLRLLPALFR